MKKTITNIQTHFVELCSKLLRRNAEMASNEGTDHSGSSLSNRLAKHFVACSAAVAMAAGTVGDASAAVVTWNANLVIPANIDGLYINVQTQASGSAGSVVAGWDINPYSATSLTWFNATGTGMLRFPGATTGSAGNLAIGTIVGATGSYGSGAVVVGANPGNWQLNATNYFGFRFIAADGLTHYGWGSMLVGSAITTRSITYLAYEDLPTTSIPVGSGVVPICSAPTLSASTVAAVCQGSADGSVNLTITGGSPTPLSILWSNGATSEDLSNVAAGTYTVTVTTNGGGCTATGSYTVADGPAPSLWYADADGDGFGDADVSQSACTQPSGYVANNTDCNDSNSAANPGVASDGCDGVDNDCDGSTDEDATLSNYYVDADGDGYGAGAATPSCAPVAGSVTADGDCDDTNNGINPGATETCNSIDDNCNWSTDEGLTAPTTTASACGSYTWSVNGQTYTASGTYIAGNAPSSIYTSLATFSAAVGAAGQTQSATENFSGFNGFYGSPITGSLGSATTWSASAVGGIYCGAVGTDQVLSTNNPEPLTISFSPSVAAVGANIFLTDINFGVVPGSVYITLSNGTIDTVAVSTFNSYSGYVSNSAQISSITIAGSGTGDVYVTVDNLSVGTGTIAPVPACSTPVLVLTINTPSTYYADSDGDGYGNPASTQSDCSQPSGYVSDNTDCNDGDNSVSPGATETCSNSVDDDCDGQTDEGCVSYTYYADSDGDGYGDATNSTTTFSSTAPSGYVSDNTDCNDSDNSVNPGVAADLCNGVDNDCDGSTDEDATFSNYYVDADGDGYGAGAATSSCSAIAGSVTVDGDCDDLSASVNPAGTEVCNSIDDDCDGSTDEGTTPVAGAISGNATGCVSVVTGSATYSIAALANASTYSWTVPTGMTIFSGQGTNSIFVTWTPGAVSNGLIGSVTVTPSNACGAGTSSSLAVDLNYTLPVRPSSISGPVRLCPGDNATYSVANVARATSYVWTLPTGMTLVSGAGTNVINVSIDGSYTGGTIACSAANACGTGPDRTRNLSVNTPAASASISGAVTGVCGANGVTYTAAAVLGATGYNWTVPAGASIVSGQGTSSISVDFTGAYAGGSISVAASNSCGTGAARSLSVSGAPGQPGAISGDVTICPGQSGVNYSVTTVAGAANYLWVVPGGAAITSGQGTKDIIVTWGTNQTSGLNMLVSASNGCGTGSTRVLNGISINVSNCVRVGEQGIATGLNLFPNPTSDRATVQFNGTEGADFRLRVVDVAGRILLNEAGTAAAGLNQREVSVRGMSAGIYFVVIETAGVTEQIRMIVE